MATIDHHIYGFDDSISNFIKKFDCEVIEVTRANGYEVNNSILYIWGFNNHSEDKQICELLKQNPSVDTLYIGKNVTDKNDLEKIHCVLLSSHNIIPIIKNIIFEDNSRFYSIDGILIDRESMSIIDYASGRNNDTIVIPYGILGLKENCFNYNEYVKHLILPSSIKEFKGITSLPKLEDVNIYNNTDFYSENGIVFSAAIKVPLFIPPYNPLYPNSDELKAIFAKIYYWVKSEAENKRWQGVTSDNFSIDPYDINDIYISYTGSFYRHYWQLYIQPLPSRIVLEYSFYEEWDVDCAASQIDESDIYEETTLIQLKCNECAYNNIWDNIYKSNDVYISNTINGLNASGIAHFKTMGKTNFNCELKIDSPIETILQTLLTFLDIALYYRLKYPIMESPLQLSLFKETEQEKTMDSTPLEDSSFCHYFSRSLGFISGFENVSIDEELPFNTIQI